MILGFFRFADFFTRATDFAKKGRLLVVFVRRNSAVTHWGMLTRCICSISWHSQGTLFNERGRCSHVWVKFVVGYRSFTEYTPGFLLVLLQEKLTYNKSILVFFASTCSRQQRSSIFLFINHTELLVPLIRSDEGLAPRPLPT